MLFSLADYLLAVTQDELLGEQQSDETLKPLLDKVVTNDDIWNQAGGCYMKDLFCW